MENMEKLNKKPLRKGDLIQLKIENLDTKGRAYGFYDENTKFLIYKGSSVMDEISGIDAQIYNEKNRNYIYFNLKNQEEIR